MAEGGRVGSEEGGPGEGVDAVRRRSLERAEFLRDEAAARLEVLLAQYPVSYFREMLGEVLGRSDRRHRDAERRR